MLAVIKTGGKQYVVSPGTKVRIEKIKAEEGQEVLFEDVFLVADGKDIQVGAPVVTGTKVKAKVLSHGKGDKLIVFKYKPKKRQRTKKGHRQPYTEIQILSVEK
ncbi:MAG: 50S ribosomal protein L21 [Candidatus Pacebacteria bacterium]|nr:50S ribosomal protein L21 [Candidatus Paceibacterota bacterium]